MNNRTFRSLDGRTLYRVVFVAFEDLPGGTWTLQTRALNRPKSWTNVYDINARSIFNQMVKDGRLKMI